MMEEERGYDYYYFHRDSYVMDELGKLRKARHRMAFPITFRLEVLLSQGIISELQITGSCIDLLQSLAVEQAVSLLDDIAALHVLPIIGFEKELRHLLKLQGFLRRKQSQDGRRRVSEYGELGEGGGEG